MAEKKEFVAESISRALYYVLAVCCFFFVFLMAVSYSPERLDAELILTFIIAVLLLTFMLHVSHRFNDIEKRMDAYFKIKELDE